jgi:hypothetical protein
MVGLMTLSGSGPPLVAGSLLAVLVLYQSLSGHLLNQSWGIWLTRRERPRAYWLILSIEAVVAFSSIYFSLH